MMVYDLYAKVKMLMIPNLLTDREEKMFIETVVFFVMLSVNVKIQER